MNIRKISIFLIYLRSRQERGKSMYQKVKLLVQQEKLILKLKTHEVIPMEEQLS